MLKWNHSEKHETDYIYEYEPCEMNSLYCDDYNQGYGQIVQYCGNYHKESCCFILAEDVQEWVLYNETSQIWSLHYNGSYALCPDSVQRHVTVYWHCNMYIDAQITSIDDSVACSYQIYIESKLACPSWMTISPTISTKAPSAVPSPSPTAPTTQNPSFAPLPLPNDYTCVSYYYQLA